MRKVIFFTIVVIFWGIVLLPVTNNAEESPTLWDIPTNFRQEFLSVQVIGNIPYVLINDPRALLKIEHHLLTGMVNINSKVRYPIKIDTSEVINIENINRHGARWSFSDYYEIIGDEIELGKVIGYHKGSVLTAQLPTPDLAGEQVKLTVDKLYFTSDTHQPYILLECLPLDSAQVELITPKDGYQVAVAHPYWHTKEKPKSMNQAIPPIIYDKLYKLKKDFFADTTVCGSDCRTSITPLSFLSAKDEEQIYYCVVFSERVHQSCDKGILYLLDRDANIIQVIRGRYRQIIGLTDLNSDGSHEVMVFNGCWDWWEFELLDFEHNKVDPPKLITKLVKGI